ncbi:hypothetical protein KSF78_0005607 [Schistosoma japonicum]|nr:hypothetical protein KSF78_0005607 [Schistosoma japonicum]
MSLDFVELLYGVRLPKMRIIILVIISTVLLLINLLQTKSQGNGEQLVTGKLFDCFNGYITHCQ